LFSKFDNAVLISTLEINEELQSINFNKFDKINIIFNQFQQSTLLYTLDEPLEYVNRAILSTTNILEYIKNNNIIVNKIIYTSSSSVYGNNTNSDENDDLNPKSLHASLKIANENLVSLFCEVNNIRYSITRVFNMYGGDDKFSIISKIINAYKNNETLNLINNGEAIRDFIHIDDVVYIYKKLLEVEDEIKIINIGTGIGKSVLFILDYLRKNNINVSSDSAERDELMVSISNNKLLTSITNNYKFKKVEEFILNNIKSNRDE
jgi:UDP-glucose 4-epimerase